MADSIANPSSKSEWNRVNLLSLDGGGIRGYWALLVLERLMKHVGEEEEIAWAEDKPNNPFAGLHSFYPFHKPSNVSQVPYTLQEKEDRGQAGNSNNAKIEATERSRRYLPCHYFDFMCGSSTGALIAIMLGRFRMTVKDCLDEYESLGRRIFGSPRPLHYMNTIFVKIEKFSARGLEKVFKEVSDRRCDATNEDPVPITLQTAPGLSRVFVTSKARKAKESVEKLYLIRSYEHHRKSSQRAFSRTMSSESNGEIRPPMRHTATGLSTVSNARASSNPNVALITNFGPASSMEIWQVARAATAAPMIFKPLRVAAGRLRDGNRRAQMTEFSDGGFGTSNNPTYEAMEEIELLHGLENLGTVVSVGTARRDEIKGKGTSFRAKMENLGNTATNPEVSHTFVSSRLESLGKGSDYYRFNENPGTLAVSLDEWQPHGMFAGSKNGQETLTKIRMHFAAWISRMETGEDKRLRECAQALVQRRRARTLDKWQWERFALGACYKCPISSCHDNSKTLDDLCEHLIQRHQWEKSEVADRDAVRHLHDVERFRTEWKYHPRPR